MDAAVLHIHAVSSQNVEEACGFQVHAYTQVLGHQEPTSGTSLRSQGTVNYTPESRGRQKETACAQINVDELFLEGRLSRIMPIEFRRDLAGMRKGSVLRAEAGLDDHRVWENSQGSGRRGLSGRLCQRVGWSVALSQLPIYHEPNGPPSDP
jgi:hypothetical protein